MVEGGQRIFAVQSVVAAVQRDEWEVDRNGYHRFYMLTDNCADSHVCGPHNFPWIWTTPGINPRLSVADGRLMTYYGEKKVPMYINEDKKIEVTFQVIDVTQPILSVGQFCDRSAQRTAWHGQPPVPVGAPKHLI